MNNVVSLISRKQLEVSAEMLEQIQAVSGSQLTADDIVVFEATAVNTLPLYKPGTIFHGGQLTRSTLTAMAEVLNSGEQKVPLHTLHRQGAEVPVGRLFQAHVQDAADGGAELRAMFYLARSEKALIEKLNLGILDEVSIGLQTKSMLCSKCGWDYRGEGATFMNLWDRTCANGHTIGVDGTHLVLQGVEQWMELSLVSRGAAKNTKIHGRAKQLMSKEQQDRIAASGFEPDVVTLFATPQVKPQTRKEVPMAEKPEVTAETPAAPAQFDAKAAHDELMTKMGEIVAALQPQADAEAEAEADQSETVSAEIEGLRTEIGELKAQLAELGKPTAADMAKDKLPSGGVAASAVTDADKARKGTSFAAFKSR